MYCTPQNPETSGPRELQGLYPSDRYTVDTGRYVLYKAVPGAARFQKAHGVCPCQPQPNRAGNPAAPLRTARSPTWNSVWISTAAAECSRPPSRPRPVLPLCQQSVPALSNLGVEMGNVSSVPDEGAPLYLRDQNRCKFPWLVPRRATRQRAIDLSPRSVQCSAREMGCALCG